MRCRECGAELPEGVVFCRYCGCKVMSVQQKRFCPACGCNIKPGTKFCADCGFDLLHGVRTDIPDDVDDDEEVEIEAAPKSPKKTGFEFWYNLDEVTKAGIFGMGFLVYLLILSIVALNTVAIVMGSLQIITLICIGLIHYEKIKTDKRWIQYLLLAALVIMSVVYIRSFYAPK